MILCLDPGSRMTGWVTLEPVAGELPIIHAHGNKPTDEVLDWLRGLVRELPLTRAVVEHVGHYGSGMPAGRDVFDTCILIGQALEILRPLPVKKILRPTIKARICGRSNSKGSHVRQALIDRWGGDVRALGAIKCAACKGKGWRGRGRPPCQACGGDGWDVEPGPLHGIAEHAWSALAAGLCYLEMKGNRYGDS